MLLEGSCACGAVTFSVRSRTPYPFNLCYCTLCRKTAGSGGFGINIGAEYHTLAVRGAEHVRIFRARIGATQDAAARPSPGRRHFCGCCGAALWVWDPRWPALVHPFASAIDTPLPAPPERVHLMLDFKASWVEPRAGRRDRRYPRLPEESIEQWHRRLGLLDED